MIRQLTVIGVGLIGGSLALALKNAGFCTEIVGAGRSRDNLDKAVELGVIDRYSTNLKEAVADADLVFLAVPMGVMASVMNEIADALPAHTIITDGGSVKAPVVDAAETYLAAALHNFVPGHPIAGDENSGVSAAFKDLYQGRRVILTPIQDATTTAALECVTAMWQAAGAAVTSMPVAQHDRVLAATSHLPHMLAFGLVDSLARLSDSDEVFRYAAGGFRDFTRIASSDPVMWRDICLANSSALLESLQRYEADMQEIHTAIEAKNGDKLLQIFTRAKQARDEFIG